MATVYKKVCPVCKQTYLTGAKNQVACSKECAGLARYGPDPTPTEIALRSDEIRSNWTKEEIARRTLDGPVPWTPIETSTKGGGRIVRKADP